MSEELQPTPLVLTPYQGMAAEADVTVTAGVGCGIEVHLLDVNAARAACTGIDPEDPEDTSSAIGFWAETIQNAAANAEPDRDVNVKGNGYTIVVSKYALTDHRELQDLSSYTISSDADDIELDKDDLWPFAMGIVDALGLGFDAQTARDAAKKAKESRAKAAHTAAFDAVYEAYEAVHGEGVPAGKDIRDVRHELREAASQAAKEAYDAAVNATDSATPEPEVNATPAPESAEAPAQSTRVNIPRFGRTEQLALLVVELDRDGWVDREALVNAIRRSAPDYNPRAVSATVSRALKTLREKGLLERQRLTPFGRKVLASITRSERLALTSEIEGT